VELASVSLWEQDRVGLLARLLAALARLLAALARLLVVLARLLVVLARLLAAPVAGLGVGGDPAGQ